MPSASNTKRKAAGRSGGIFELTRDATGGRTYRYQFQPTPSTTIPQNRDGTMNDVDVDIRASVESSTATLTEGISANQSLHLTQQERVLSGTYVPEGTTREIKPTKKILRHIRKVLQKGLAKVVKKAKGVLLTARDTIE